MEVAERTDAVTFSDQIITPLKFNMEPEKKSLEKELPFGNHHFSGSMLNLGGVRGVKKTCLLVKW